ncbi:MAG: extracellular solute-binding protein [Clostridia bacterium]|nr:extracellular solute-binding protein [Clostridia bacterium]
MKRLIAVIAVILITVGSVVPISVCATSAEENFHRIGENSSFSSGITVANEGEYTVRLKYKCDLNSSADPVIGLLIDGVYPFEGAEKITLDRGWKDNAEQRYDIQGNEIRPSQLQADVIFEKILKDNSVASDDVYLFELNSGIHKVTVITYEQPIELYSVELVEFENLPEYSKAVEQYRALGAKEILDVNPILIQAEKPSLKSAQSLLSVNDRASSITQPYDAVKARYNCIGGGRWSENGQWLEWEINIPQTGLYPIALRWKQDQKNNDISSRAIYIDGEIPFKEAATLEFPYSNKWQVSFIGEKETEGGYLFYLTEGKHTLRLEATIGRQKELIADMQRIIGQANQLYLDIVMVTGPSPDINRDYDYEKLIPDTLKEMLQVSKELKGLEAEVITLSGESGQNTSSIKRLYGVIDKMTEDSETISRRLGDFQDAISSLAVSLTDMRSQPLTVDYLTLGAKKNQLKAEGSFFAQLIHYIKQYIGSFAVDYNTLGNTKESDADALRVWLGADTTVIAASAGGTAGRDQSQIVRELVTDDFSSNTGIPVSVQLVNTGSLLPATLAGIGPDVALGLAQATPVNYALRNALYNLSEFEDCAEILNGFNDAAVLPFTLDGSVYAIPETMVYPMLFYRSDILSECGVELDELETWDSLLQVALPKLQMKYLEFGVPATYNTFSTLLLQNGGAMYNEEHTASAFNSTQGMAAFKLMTSLYTEYRLDLSFNFLNRFRSGQMPLAIQDYTMYNQISVYAPEIEGLWGMLPVCGIKDAAGQVNRTVAGTMTGCGITSYSKLKEEAWEFVKWWTKAETQIEFSQALEAVLGTAARNPTANLEARESLAWSSDIKDALRMQEASLSCIPEIAGGYYSSRNYDFAFRDVVYEGKDIKATLNSAAESIDTEIAEKRNEFYGE